MKVTNEQKEKAMSIYNSLEGSKIEHLLRFQPLGLEKKDLINVITEITEHLFQFDSYIASYHGCTWQEDNEENITELFFRCDRVIEEDDIYYLLQEIDGVFVLSFDHKTMVTNDSENVYEELEYHYDIWGIGNVYGYDDAVIMDICDNDIDFFKAIK